MSSKSVEESPALVIDSCSGFCKVGFAGAPCPHSVIPSVVARPRGSTVAALGSDTQTYVGDEALERSTDKRDVTVKRPVEQGVVTNWDDMPKVWRHAFHKTLSVDPSEHCIVLTEPVCNPISNRDKSAQVMFEEFEVSGLYLAVRSVLSLLATGRRTGVVLDCGDAMTTSLPVFDGFGLPYAVAKCERGGRDVTDHLMTSLTSRGYSYTTSADRSLVQRIKEATAYASPTVAATAGMEAVSDAALGSGSTVGTAGTAGTQSVLYTLDDGTQIEIGAERTECVNVLFNNPDADTCFGAGGRDANVQQMIMSSVERCQTDLEESMLANVVLAGGPMQCAGMAERVAQEMKALAVGKSIGVTVAPAHSSWVGGALLAASPAFRGACVSSEEYDEIGPAAVQWKCF